MKWLPVASKTIVILTDDLDGGEAERTVTFSIDGSHYEIELNHSNVDKLSGALGPFISAARRTAKDSRRVTAPSSNLADVRTWARSQGFQVSDRGRISAEILDAYEQRD